MNKVTRASVVAMTLTVLSTSAWAIKPCDELKGEIDAKLKAKGVTSYTLDIVANDDVKEQKVVGSCDGGTKKIVYSRGSQPAETSPPAK